MQSSGKVDWPVELWPLVAEYGEEWVEKFGAEALEGKMPRLAETEREFKLIYMWCEVPF